ncbi:MAG: TIGR04053 family radical SAM/SPASM domain-containing protein [Pseudomonadota bacterium]
MPDYSKSPFLVIWETTQACDLTCKHCRASAQPHPLPGELSFEEGKKLLDDISGMGCRIVVLSGGDPLKRPDLYDLIRHGKSNGLRMATIPAATELLQRDVLFELKEAGADQVAFSLDFPTAELHDNFRGTPGAYRKTMQAVGWAHEAALPVQINTTITALSLPYLEEMGRLVQKFGIVFWEVFFLVPVGRGSALQALTAEDCERAFEILYRVHKECSFVLKVTEAPHYRRYVAQVEHVKNAMPDRLRQSEGPGGTVGLAPHAVNAGKGFLFVSYNGDIYSSGFLALAAGNVRQGNLAGVYRQSRLFQELRSAAILKGKCGICEYREICGGSRSRAYALTRDYLAEEPWCVFEPPTSAGQIIS